MRTVRHYLKKFNIVSDAQKEYRVLKKYFTATTEKDKAEAFTEIEKYLEQFAKEALQVKKGSTYEDCLQEARVKFFEFVYENKEEDVLCPQAILKKIRESMVAIPEEIETVSLDALKKSNEVLSVDDMQIKMFESNNFHDVVWNYFIRSMNCYLKAKKM